MRICKKCGNEFPSRIEINGKMRYFQKRIFCLECSPFDKRKNKNWYKLPEFKYCKVCDKTLVISDFYISKKGKPLHYCKICTNKQTTDRQKNLKRWCIEQKGGECKNCGYKKYDGALEFHHVDADKKDFNVSHLMRTNVEKNKELIIAELSKCILLCSNCHRERHAGLH